jgi:hypothetical protein
MTRNAIQEKLTPPANMRYAASLRCIGQFLDAMDLKAIEIKMRSDTYVVHAWNKGTSMATDLEKHWTADDLKQLDVEGRKKRKAHGGPLNLLGLSQTLRSAGNYVDRTGGRLLRVSWQEQSDKIQSITLQWEPPQATLENGESQLKTVEELCVHIYKQRKKINLASERQPHRPFVSVGRAE